MKTATVTLSDTASPHSTDYQGINDNYETVNFNVPNNVDRLNGAIAFQGSSTALSARVRLALIDPNGRLAEYSVPQGIGNYGDVQVTDPAAGKWTAYIWSRDSADGGTTGPVVFGASVASYQNFGQLSKSSLNLAAHGGTGSFTLSVNTPQAQATRPVRSPSPRSARLPPRWPRLPRVTRAAPSPRRLRPGQAVRAVRPPRWARWPRRSR